MIFNLASMNSLSTLNDFCWDTKTSNCFLTPATVLFFVDSNSIKERLETLSEDKKIIGNFQINALNKMKNQTWESYVSDLDQFILDYKNKKN